MKIVTLDIETTPILAQVWRLREPYIAPNQVVEPSRLLCLGWKDMHGPRGFAADWIDGHAAMVEESWHVLNDADVIVHFNGRSFDVPRMNTEFLLAGLTPPAPFAQVDLYRAIRSRFGFASNRLEYIVGQHVLNLEQSKLKTDMSLWTPVMAGDAKAQARMRRYCQRDVDVTEKLHDAILPWIERYPNAGLYADDVTARCVNCGSTSLAKEGFTYTSAGKFQRYRCTDCGRWSRAAKRERTTPLREATT